MKRNVLIGAILIQVLVMIMATVGMANPPQSDEPATLYIVRPAQVAVAIKFKVQIDGSYAGFTRGRKYIKKTLSPGTHKIQSKAENMAEYDLKVEPGKTYYIKQQVTLGVTARNELVLLDETNGKAALEKCKPSKDMGE